MDPADPADSEPRKRQRSDVPEQEQAALDAAASAVSSAESQTLAELRTETFVDGFRVPQSPGQRQPPPRPRNSRRNSRRNSTRDSPRNSTRSSSRNSSRNSSRDSSRDSPRDSPRNSPRPGNSPSLSANMVALTVDMAAAMTEPAHDNPSQQTPGSAASSTRKNPPRDARQIELSAVIEDILSRHLQLISQRQQPQGASQPLDAAGSATAPTIIPNLSSGQQPPTDQGSSSNNSPLPTTSTAPANHEPSGDTASINSQAVQPVQEAPAADETFLSDLKTLLKALYSKVPQSKSDAQGYPNGDDEQKIEAAVNSLTNMPPAPKVSPNSDFLHDDHLLDTLVNLLKDQDTTLAAVYQKRSDAMARLLEALKQLELHIVTAHPTLSRDLARMRNVFVHRRFKAFLGPHKKMPDVFVYMELVGSSIRLLDMVAKGRMRIVPRPTGLMPESTESAQPAAATSSGGGSATPMQVDASGSVSIWISLPLDPPIDDPRKPGWKPLLEVPLPKVVEIEIERNEDIQALYFKIQNLCSVAANKLRISPGRMATNIIFDRTDRISDLLAKYPSSQNKPWASWTSSTRLPPSALVKARAQDIQYMQGNTINTALDTSQNQKTTRSSKSSGPSTRPAIESLPIIDFYNMPPDVRDEHVRLACEGVDNHVKTLPVDEQIAVMDAVASTISSMLKQAPSSYATEFGIHSWAYKVFSPLIDLRVLPHGAMFDAPSSGKVIPDRKLVVSRDGQSIPVLFEFKKAWADLRKRLTNLVGFANNPENSDEPEYSNLRQTVGYASAERSPCCVLSFGEETYYIDLVCFTDGGTGAFVQGPVLPSHACVVPKEPSLRAMAAGMAFRLLGILENEALAHPPLEQVGFIMGGNSGAGGGADAPGSGSTSQHGQEQPPASNAGPSGGESSRGAPSQSGAADGGASDSLPADTTAQPREAQVVKQDSGTDVTFGEGKLQKQKPKQYAVVITDRPDHELESVVHQRLHDHPEWKDSFAAGFYLAIGRMIGASRHGTVRSALICGVPAVAKFVMIEYMRAFVTERSNYTRVEKLQGRSIAWLHDTCVCSVDSSVLIVERGEVLAPVRDIYDQFINPREALDKLTDDNGLRALEALNDIHSIGALHGDAHLGNVGFTVTNGRPRAFWFDLEHMTFPTENLKEKQEKEKQQFIDEWKLTVYQLNASLK
ncbi:hypothetical protein HK105_207224 [Polyrhizophydium stewartii]|uniref:Uncharacterized protein n=1 Tax=Polyrhizophydium stewartii TaxID=2732419 RepID=A0ABR4N114_9FUNG